MQAGRLTEAEALCREIVGNHPNEPGLQHLLGLLNYQLARLDVALELMQRAITLNPNEAEFHNNFGVVLLAAGQAEKAVGACSRAASLRSPYPEASNNLGNALMATGRVNEAIAAYDRALQQRPTYAEAISNRGNALKQLGRLTEAIAAYELAIRHQPNYADAHSNLGIALQIAGRRDDAINAYRRALALQPANPDTWNNLGIALFDALKLDEALECFRKATSLRPAFADAFKNTGLVLQKLGQTEAAIANHRQALHLKPDFADDFTALGASLRQAGQLDEAITCYQRALSLQPQNADALTFLGAALQEKGQLNEAMALQRQAIALQPDHPEAHLNLAFMLLAEGNYRDGWPEYEWRRKQKNSAAPERNFPVPQWRGEELAGKRILIHAEQGLGDAIQFVRYIPLLSQRGGKVLLECYPELHRLFSSIPGVDQFLISGLPLPPFDLHCPMLSLPLAFGTTLESIPSPSPYLKADPDLAAHWAKKFSSSPGQKKVGIAWAGRPDHFNDRNRSIPPHLFTRLGNIPGIQYVSLQKRLTPDQKHSLPDFEITDWTNDLHDLADTAALIANLDLIITVDTAIAHLAGALAKRTWVLLPHPADFRWLLNRNDSPWYPTLRLYRQSRARDWDEPLARIAHDLRDGSVTVMR
jgi:tetratricopeptide (TPR) repeat protein